MSTEGHVVSRQMRVVERFRPHMHHFLLHKHSNVTIIVIYVVTGYNNNVPSEFQTGVKMERPLESTTE